MKEVCRASGDPALGSGETSPTLLGTTLVANSGLGSAHRLGAQWLFDKQKGMEEENKSWKSVI